MRKSGASKRRAASKKRRAASKKRRAASKKRRDASKKRRDASKKRRDAAADRRKKKRKKNAATAAAKRRKSTAGRSATATTSAAAGPGAGAKEVHPRLVFVTMNAANKGGASAGGAGDANAAVIRAVNEGLESDGSEDMAVSVVTRQQPAAGGLLFGRGAAGQPLETTCGPVSGLLRSLRLMDLLATFVVFMLFQTVAATVTVEDSCVESSAFSCKVTDVILPLAFSTLSVGMVIVLFLWLVTMYEQGGSFDDMWTVRIAQATLPPTYIWFGLYASMWILMGANFLFRLSLASKDVCSDTNRPHFESACDIKRAGIPMMIIGASFFVGNFVFKHWIGCLNPVPLDDEDDAYDDAYASEDDLEAGARPSRFFTSQAGNNSDDDDSGYGYEYAYVYVDESDDDDDDDDDDDSSDEYVSESASATSTITSTASSSSSSS